MPASGDTARCSVTQRNLSASSLSAQNDECGLGRCHSAIRTACNQLAVLAPTHRPAATRPAYKIQHDTKVQPVLSRTNVNDIGDEFLLGLR